MELGWALAQQPVSLQREEHPVWTEADTTVMQTQSTPLPTASGWSMARSPPRVWTCLQNPATTSSCPKPPSHGSSVTTAPGDGYTHLRGQSIKPCSPPCPYSLQASSLGQPHAYMSLPSCLLGTSCRPAPSKSTLSPNLEE